MHHRHFLQILEQYPSVLGCHLLIAFTSKALSRMHLSTLRLAFCLHILLTLCVEPSRRDSGIFARQ